MKLILTKAKAIGDDKKLLELELWFNDNVYVLADESISDPSIFPSPDLEDAEDKFFELYYDRLCEYVVGHQELPLGIRLVGQEFDCYSYKPPEAFIPCETVDDTFDCSLPRWSHTDLEMVKEILPDLWLATHSQAGELCYKKVARRGVEHETVREITTLVALADLPSIAHLKGLVVDSQSKVCGLALEYVPGHTLKQRMKAEDLTKSDKQQVYQQLCQIVDQVHTRGCHHGDIKPSNIMVTPQLEVKLIDWGGGTTKQYNPTYDLSPRADYRALEIIQKELDI